MSKWAHKLGSLTDLDLHNTKSDLEGANTQAFQDLFAQCRQLVTVNFSGCLGLSDAAVLQVPDFCLFLQSLNLRGCKSMSGMGFTFLKQATSLTRLKLGGCDQITERAFAHTISGLSNLTKLDASDLDGLSDSGVELMLKSCPKLKRLTS